MKAGLWAMNGMHAETRLTKFPEIVHYSIDLLPFLPEEPLRFMFCAAPCVTKHAGHF